ncbi:MAG: hypothetical protein SGPRY_012483, partial [Prymnesium sp.]
MEVANDSLPSLSALAGSRLALCMVGAARTLLLPPVHASIRSHLLDSQLAPVDVFAHLHLGWDATDYAPGMGEHGPQGESIAPDDPALVAALSVLRPVETRLHHKSGCAAKEVQSHPVCVGLKVHRGAGPSQGERAGFLQSMWLNECHRSVMRYEVSNQLRYAWVIRTRPDLAFFDRVPSCITMSTRRLVCMEKESNPSYFDGFWMVRVRAAEPMLIPHPQIYAHLATPRQLLEDLTSAIDLFWTSTWQRNHNLPWPPEWHLFPFLRSNRIPWSVHPIPAVLVRRGGRLDCWRLARKEKQEIVFEMGGSSFGRSADGEHLMSFFDACRSFEQMHWPKAMILHVPKPLR